MVRCCNYNESLQAALLTPRLLPRLSWHHNERNRIATKPMYHSSISLYLHFELCIYEIEQGLPAGHLYLSPETARRGESTQSAARRGACSPHDRHLLSQHCYNFSVILEKQRRVGGPSNLARPACEVGGLGHLFVASFFYCRLVLENIENRKKLLTPCKIEGRHE